jgi:alkylation response protein AidB-like acyl-CoA dehydrogenase
LLGLCIPEEYGGSGAGITGLAIAIEEVTKYSNVLGLMLLLTRLPTGPIMIAGTEDQKQRYLPGIANGTRRSAFCLSEPGAGSDVAGMQTRASEDPEVPGGYILNGTKCWISGGMQADWFIVFAKLGDPSSRLHSNISSFIVDADTPGVTRPRVDKKMGVKGIDTAEIHFENVKVAPANVLGGSFSLIMQSLNAMRPIVAARGLGLAEGALMYATEYVKNRPAFGKTIAEFQGIQWEIAKCATEIEAARLLTYRAAWLADQGKFSKEYVPMLSMSKYYASEVAVKASGLALQMLGAAGYMEDHPMELYYRDARQLTIVEGTSQVQLGLIAKGVLGHDLWWD